MTLTFKLYTFSVDKLKGDDEDTKLIVYSNGTVVWDQSVISKVSFLSFSHEESKSVLWNEHPTSRISILEIDSRKNRVGIGLILRPTLYENISLVHTFLLITFSRIFFG